MTKFNLLGKNPVASPRMSGIDDTMLYDIARIMYDNEDEQRYALEVLRSPLCSCDDIIYRNDIIKDFAACNDLLDRLSTLTGGVADMRSAWLAERREFFSRKRADTEAGLSDDFVELNNKLEMLRCNSAFFLKLTDILKSLVSLLAEYTLVSEGLLEYKGLCVDLYAAHAFSDAPMARRIVAVGSSPFSAELLIGLNEKLAVNSAELYSIGESCPVQRNADDFDASDDVSAGASLLLKAAVSDFDDLFVERCENILELLSETNRQLRFFHFTADYCDALHARGCSYSFPQILPSEACVTSFSALRDPVDVIKGNEAVPHDLILDADCRGVVVTGQGGVGKTGLLRAVCVSQILAQCGLPIPCRDAVLSVKRGIFACFSDVSADVEPDLDGRVRLFETEAAKVAAIIERLAPYSLVVLNEIFESVSFGDAADALYNIFSVISQYDIEFFATTHLPQLAERFVEIDKVTALSMNESGKLHKLGG